MTKTVSIYAGAFCEYPGFNNRRSYAGEADAEAVLNAINEAGDWGEEITAGEATASAADMLYSLAGEFDINTDEYESFGDLQSAIEEVMER